jgi:hypothetical protein
MQREPSLDQRNPKSIARPQPLFPLEPSRPAAPAATHERPSRRPSHPSGRWLRCTHRNGARHRNLRVPGLRPRFHPHDVRRGPPGAAEPPPESRLAGLAFTAKDLFDVAGQPTPAGSVVLSHAPAAKADAIAVARLRAAGGVLTGRTNMSEFAFSGVGVNPHHGTPVNVSDKATPRIPGGSSSGAAISVASGAAFIGLGSDTGGSIRIPAALNGIVGFKNTARLVPADGALPLSTTLDTVCAMTRSVRDAITAHEILSAAPRDGRLRHPSLRLQAGRREERVLRRHRARRGRRLRAHAENASRRGRPHRGNRAARARRPAGHQRHRRLLGGRVPRLAPPAAGAQRRGLRPARGPAHPARRQR